MATVHNIQIDQGSPFKVNFLVKNADLSLKDLTGYTAHMQFRTSYSSDVVRLEATTSNGKLEIDVDNHFCSISLSADDSALLIYSGYVYDVDLIDSSGSPTRIVQGCVTLNPEVTRN